MPKMTSRFGTGFVISAIAAFMIACGDQAEQQPAGASIASERPTRSQIETDLHTHIAVLADDRGLGKTLQTIAFLGAILEGIATQGDG